MTNLRWIAGALVSLVASSLLADTDTLGSKESDSATTETLGVSTDVLLGEPEGKPLYGEELDATVTELASQMRCPVCQGLSIEASPVETARDMKAEVRDLAEQGYTKEQILSYFETRYGEFVLLVPKPQGLNLLLWIAPVVAILLGFALVANRRRGVTSEDDQQAGVEEYLDQVQQETAS